MAEAAAEVTEAAEALEAPEALAPVRLAGVAFTRMTMKTPKGKKINKNKIREARICEYPINRRKNSRHIGENTLF
jgi:hypothetical protein